MGSWLGDLRLAARGLVRDPVFTSVVVVCLALGIGANTAIFSIVNAFLWAPPPVAEPDRLVAVFTEDVSNPGLHPVSFPNYLDLADGSGVLTEVVGYLPFVVDLAAGERRERLPAELVTPNYFTALGVEALHGRTFLPSEESVEGTEPVAVLSHPLWERQFGGDPGVVGETIRVAGYPVVVVGVAPEGFTGLNRLRTNQLWLPTGLHDEVLSGVLRDWFPYRDTLLVHVVGRLAPGVGAKRAAGALEARMLELVERHPVDNKGLDLHVTSLQQATIRPQLRGRYVRSGTLLLAIVGLLLVIACASVANLLLARSLGRRREMAVRMSLGARRFTLLRQWLAESLLLTTVGAVVGVGIAQLLSRALFLLRPPFLPASFEAPLDVRVLAFTVALALVTGLLLGIAPVVQLRVRNLVPALKQLDDSHTARGRAWGLREALVVLQVAVSLVALVAAGLFLGSLATLQGRDPGFDVGRVVALPLDLASREGGDPHLAYRQLAERLAATPGVESVSSSRAHVLGGGALRLGVTPEGDEPGPDGSGPSVLVDHVGAGYFRTLGIPLLQGRGIGAADRSGAPRVAVVNRAMAQRFWPGGAIGERLRFTGEETSVEIVGVAENAVYGSLGDDPEPYVYLSLDQGPAAEVMVYARVAGDPERYLEPLAREARAVDPAFGLLPPEPLAESMRRSLWAPRLAASLLSFFGGLALVLAAVGIYGVTAHSVRRRRRELGIRLAMGAQRGDLLRMVLRQGMARIGLGLTLGFLLALWAGPVLAGLLVEIDPRSPGVLAAAAVVLFLVALLAYWLPARRATRIDPALTLRNE